MMKVKRDIVALIQLVINYMFLIMFSSLSIYFYFLFMLSLVMSLSLNLFKLIFFLDDINSFHIDTNTLVLDHHAPFSLHMATLAHFEIMDPLPPHSFQHLHKSNRLPYFYLFLLFKFFYIIFSFYD